MVLRVQRRREIPFRVAAHRAAAVATEKGHCLANTDEARTFLKKVRGLSSEVRPVLPIIQATVNGVTHAEVSALARETGGGFNFSELTHLGDDTPPQFHLGEEFFLLVVKKPR